MSEYLWHSTAINNGPIVYTVTIKRNSCDVFLYFIGTDKQLTYVLWWL